MGKRPDEIYGKTDIENGWDPELVKGNPAKGIKGFEQDDLDALSGKTIHNPYDPANVCGDIRIFDTIKLPLKSDKGDIIGVFGIARDVTETKRLEQEKKRLVEIIDSSPNFVGFADAKDKRIQYVNKAGRQMCGIGSDEDITKLKIEDLHPAGANHKLSTEILPVAVRDKSWSGECAFKNIKDNKEIPVLMVVIPLMNPNGEIEILATISQDISKLKKEQYERLNLEKQLYQSQKMEAIGSLSGSIAHDMNNIFSAISAYTSLFLSEYLKNDPKKDYIQKVQDLGKKGADIVNQIRKFSKPKEIIFEPIDIKPVVEDILNLLQIRLRHIAATSVTVIPKQRLPIMGDATQISQMLLNLISNSCDAMEGKWGKLDITIDEVSFLQNALPLPELKPGRYLKLTIKDTGRGMTSEVKKRIFDTFFTTKEDNGTGLGLSIVKRVISSHNGAISVDSKLDKGTSFYIYFPVISNIPDRK
ncbi:MAG TPA: hypothetical protein DD381_08390 [Lentisphaeria bacterium]|nr:MAG: hypothetical protein A2X47_11300 [Lentisphaerae bacterium GWF2_38_69]HBM16341.1 hypothetical protein [Lentisphaeria bacterium]